LVADPAAAGLSPAWEDMTKRIEAINGILEVGYTPAGITINIELLLDAD
jgi:hypothetical protein